MIVIGDGCDDGDENLDVCRRKSARSMSKHCVHWLKPSQSRRYLIQDTMILSNLLN